MNTTVDIDHELTQYERACTGFDALRPDARAEVERHVRGGVALWHDLCPAGRASPLSPDKFSRLQAAMTRVATSWLAPRYVGETRDTIYARIPSLRPVAENERLQELMEKNNEGKLTAAERREFDGLADRAHQISMENARTLLAERRRSGRTAAVKGRAATS